VPGHWRVVEGEAGSLRVYETPAASPVSAGHSGPSGLGGAAEGRSGRASPGGQPAAAEPGAIESPAGEDRTAAGAGEAAEPAEAAEPPELAEPAEPARVEPVDPAGSVVVLCHELPRDPDRATDAGRGYPALADRLSEECGCRVVAPMFRGTSGSAGDFSANGWLADLFTVADAEVGPGGTLWLIGFGFGGAIALRSAANDPRVSGVASIAGPADLTAWTSNREKVLDRCRRSGVVSTEGFPPDLDAWVAEIVALAPLDAAARLGLRPLLVVHGSDDAEVPVAAARAVSDAATNGPVDLRIVPAAGHWLRADPRVVATLVGWIERHR
jgi:pimeloyl-ACP methyl ester carboxylesterase